MIEQLFSGKDLIGGGGQEVEQLQFFWGHVNILPLVEYRVVRQVDDKIRVFHILSGRSGFRRRLGLKAPQHGFDPGYQFFGVEGFDDIVVCAQLQPQNFVKDFSFCGEHDDGHIRFVPDLPADLVTVDTREHKIEKDQIGTVGIKSFEGFLSVVDDPCVEALFGQIEGDQLCDIIIIIYNQDFLFGDHVCSSCYFLNVTIVTPASPSPNSARWNSETYLTRRR